MLRNADKSSDQPTGLLKQECCLAGSSRKVGSMIDKPAVDGSLERGT